MHWLCSFDLWENYDTEEADKTNLLGQPFRHCKEMQKMSSEVVFPPNAKAKYVYKAWDPGISLYYFLDYAKLLEQLLMTNEKENSRIL